MNLSHTQLVRVISSVVVVLIAVFLIVVFSGRKVQNKNTFTSPVYVSGDSSTLLMVPLYVQGTVHQQAIDDFKKKILARVALGTPLSSVEKSVVETSLATTPSITIGGITVANQTLFHFNTDELQLIAAALNNK